MIHSLCLCLLLRGSHRLRGPNPCTAAPAPESPAVSPALAPESPPVAPTLAQARNAPAGGQALYSIDSSDMFLYFIISHLFFISLHCLRPSSCPQQSRAGTLVQHSCDPQY